jgi:hypothetical protein
MADGFARASPWHPSVQIFSMTGTTSAIRSIPKRCQQAQQRRFFGFVDTVNILGKLNFIAVLYKEMDVQNANDRAWNVQWKPLLNH